MDSADFHIIQAPKYEWELAPTGDFFTMTICLARPPNAFHRLMQRVVLGFKYRRKQP